MASWVPLPPTPPCYRFGRFDLVQITTGPMSSWVQTPPQSLPLNMCFLLAFFKYSLSLGDSVIKMFHLGLSTPSHFILSYESVHWLTFACTTKGGSLSELRSSPPLWIETWFEGNLIWWPSGKIVTVGSILGPLVFISISSFLWSRLQIQSENSWLAHTNHATIAYMGTSYLAGQYGSL